MSFILCRYQIMSRTTILIHCVLCLITKTSSLSASGIVLSALIRNLRDTPVECIVSWSTVYGRIPVQDVIRIESNKYNLIFEKEMDVDLWTGDTFIEEIHCGDLVLSNPFPRVFSVERLWEFRIESDRIVSVGGSSYIP